MTIDWYSLDSEFALCSRHPAGVVGFCFLQLLWWYHRLFNAEQKKRFFEGHVCLGDVALSFVTLQVFSSCVILHHENWTLGRQVNEGLISWDAML